MTEIAVICPVLARPQNAMRVAESLIAATACSWELIFVCSPNDSEEIAACAELVTQDTISSLVVGWPPGAGDYAKKIQYGYEATKSPYVLCAADDLRFHAGWDEAALAVAREFDVGVIGTNDLGNGSVIAGNHSTHPLVSRCYIDVRGGTFDENPGVLYHPGYSHQQVDTELVTLAKERRCYAHCHESIVEHLHPLWKKSEMGATYRKALADGRDDQKLFADRLRSYRSDTV